MQNVTSVNFVTFIARNSCKQGHLHQRGEKAGRASFSSNIFIKNSRQDLQGVEEGEGLKNFISPNHQTKNKGYMQQSKSRNYTEKHDKQDNMQELSNKSFYLTKRKHKGHTLQEG